MRATSYLSFSSFYPKMNGFAQSYRQNFASSACLSTYDFFCVLVFDWDLDLDVGTLVDVLCALLARLLFGVALHRTRTDWRLRCRYRCGAFFTLHFDRFSLECRAR